MQLNSLKPARGAVQQKRRVGRGIGSGMGKTAGRGHKGQRSRAGGFHKTGFEGGQMPLQRRLPKRGFSAFKRKQIAKQSVNIRLSELNKLADEIIDLTTLKNNKIVSNNIKNVRIYLSGQLTRKITVKNILLSNGARAAVEAAGGSIE